MTDPNAVYRDAIRRIAGGRIRECSPPPDLAGRFAVAGGVRCIVVPPLPVQV
ncbi:hypothetical protein [Methanoculleus chikugoensis]|uniref:hypothetical protein n=1 Tax=Methanoculleus chikugoensis TaxID=118126 RepID=UPI000A45714A|nr:hypothetical protein [Methanoculleus chikugoensis]